MHKYDKDAMSLISYPHVVVDDVNQPIFNEAVEKMKTCYKHAAVALAVFAIRVAYDALMMPKTADNNITIYDADAEPSLDSSCVFVIFTLLFGLGTYAIFAHICKMKGASICLKEIENDETIKFESMKLEWLDLPLDVIEKHMQPKFRLELIGVIGQVSKQWNAVSKHMLVRGLNERPFFVFDKLKINSPEKGIKAVEEYFGEHTVKITHLPEECPVSNYKFNKFPNLEEFTFAPFIPEGKTNHTIELGTKVRRLNLQMDAKCNLKIQNLKNLKSLKLQNWCHSANIDIGNLPNIETISIDFFKKINKLNFDQCSVSKLHIGTRILSHNISSLTSLKDLVIMDCGSLINCPVLNPSIERVHLSHVEFLENLPPYPLLNTLVLGLFSQKDIKQINPDLLIGKYPELKKLILNVQAMGSRSVDIHVYVEKSKEKFENYGIELVEVNLFIETTSKILKRLERGPDNFFDESSML